MRDSVRIICCIINLNSERIYITYLPEIIMLEVNKLEDSGEGTLLLVPSEVEIKGKYLTGEFEP